MKDNKCLNLAYLFEIKIRVFGYIKNNICPAVFLIVVYVVALFPLFRANFNYRDDGGRVLSGFDGWDNFGRWTTNTLSHVVHADEYIRDISPLPQIVAVLLILAASMILLKVVRGEKKITIWDAVCVLPLGLFPYFLCCFSYKFDSPYMALSVLVSVLPFAFRSNRKVFYIAAFICTLLMCTTYQASAGIFPMIVVFTAFLDWKNGEKAKKVLYYCLLSALVFLTAMLIFFVLVPKGDSGYVAEKMSFDSLSIKHIIENYVTYISTFRHDFRVTKWFSVIAIISALFVVRNVLETKKNKFLTAVLSILVYGVIFVLSFGPYPLLDEPFLMPRGMYGICMFITLVCLGATPNSVSGDGSKVKMYSIRIVEAVSWIGIVALCWLCIVFSCTYGNAVSSQKSYDEFRIAEVVDELAELPQLNGEEKATISVIGTVGYAPGIRGIPGDKILERLMMPPFGGENYWSYLRLLSYYGLPNMEYSEELSNEDYTNWDIAHENCYHTLYTLDNKIVVKLKEG